MKGVYLLHFEPRYKHAGHYRDDERRIKGGPAREKRVGSLARLCPTCKAAKHGDAN